ncbi:MAG TPA: BON domain-containing protein [Steroidobacteraceae bacterium]|nr:BON domain-containing protein [Steroidobacteraceae bacterium]
MRAWSDVEIRTGVEEELRCCPDVDETDIAVKVTDGIVTLTGFVRNFLHKYGAEDAVGRVPGVTAVANDIRVRALGGDTADSEIARRVVAALRRELPLCWQQIRPVVRDGNVTLEGKVEWIHQRAEAEGIVRGVRGVVRVVNSIVLAAAHL